jgi:hypothetical protein
MLADSTERVHLSVAEARALSERAMRGIGYDPEEARILADHVIDAALCGYEYSGLPKLLNVADHPRFKARRSPQADAAQDPDRRIGRAGVKTDHRLRDEYTKRFRG